MFLKNKSRIFRSGHAYHDIELILKSISTKGKCLDFPAGKGVNIDGIRRAGFEPIAADLYPEYFSHKGIQAVKADFNEKLPFEDSEFQVVLHSEGIEHCPCQLQLLKEFWRVLKPGGNLLITTPNILNLRARLSFLLNGHYSFARLPIAEGSQIWDASEDGRVYIGHVFCVNYFSLRLMLRLSGFTNIKVHTAKFSLSACMMAPFFWLPICLATRRLFKKKFSERGLSKAKEILTHLTSKELLFGKKLIVLV
jgi:SAM-dependent methyltransferase